MGKPTGFLEFKRQLYEEEAIEQRILHFKEFVRLPHEGILRQQAARCMDCGIPYCHSDYGCPLGNVVPEWNDLVYHNLWKEAYERLEMTNNFPEFTGRVCPAPCETACTLSINDSPVTIRQIELAVIEHAFAMGWVTPRPPRRLSGKKVAVVGSGPAGLAAAQQLRRAGHNVTVFEKAPRPGGLLRFGIPNFKLDKSIVDRRINQLREEGVIFETNTEIGRDISAQYLRKSFDALLITVGAEQPRDLKVEGRELEGIHFALEYLAQANNRAEGMPVGEPVIDARGKTVLVIGGGDTGSDCVGTAIRQGAKQVYQFEILPKPSEWEQSWNPDWPYWPKILRTSSSHKEGGQRDWSILTKRFIGQNGRVEKGVFSRLKWEGSPPQMKEIPDSQFELDVNLVLLAMGFVHVQHGPLVEQLHLQLDDRGNIFTHDGFATSEQGVFAAGDAQSGASLVVRAIAQGREAAEKIDEYLEREK